MADPRTERLLSDHQRAKNLESRSRFIHILETKGAPPHTYRMRFTCKGIEKLNGNSPVYREHHEMEILLGPKYPLELPKIKCLTPIYHPNISRSSGNVCIGTDWTSGGRYLDDLLIYLAQMIRYEGFDLTVTSGAYERSIYDWAVKNRGLFPVDKRPLLNSPEVRIISSKPAANKSSPSQVKVLGKK